MIARCHMVCFTNLFGAPFAGSPVKCFSLMDHLVHSPYRFFDGSVHIGAMAEKMNYPRRRAAGYQKEIINRPKGWGINPLSASGGLNQHIPTEAFSGQRWFLR